MSENNEDTMANDSFLIYRHSCDLSSSGSSTFRCFLYFKEPYALVIEQTESRSLGCSEKTEKVIKIPLTFQQMEVAKALMKCIDIEELAEIKDNGVTMYDSSSTTTIEKGDKVYSINNMISHQQEYVSKIYQNKSFRKFQALYNHIDQIIMDKL